MLLIVLIFKSKVVFYTSLLFYQVLENIISGNTASLMQLQTLDYDLIASLIFLWIICFSAILSSRVRKLLNHKVDPTGIIIILLAIAYFFAPLITTNDPNYKKDIGLTKLQPPFTVLNFVRSTSIEQDESHDDITNLKNKLKPYYQPDNYYITDINKNDSTVVLIQNNRQEEILKKHLLTDEGDVKIFSKLFILGTDEFGRDIFSRVVYGARLSLTIGFLSIMIAAIIGIPLGFYAGFKGGIINSLLTRFTEAFLSIPTIFLVLMILAMLGNNLFSVIIVLGLSGWMTLFKIVKSEVLSITEKEYFKSAVNIGLNKKKLLTREILPVISSPMLASMIIQFTNVILAESTLSYLGLGSGIESVSWGSMIQSGQEYLSSAWWMLVMPGVVLVITLFVFNEAGSRIRKKLNPRITI